MKDLVIVGTGGFAREIHQLVEDLNDERASWNVLGFVDDDVRKAGGSIHDLPILGTRGWLGSRPVAVALGVGATAARRHLVRSLREGGTDLSFPVLRHPRASIGNRVTIGEGTIICAGNLITTDLTIGSHVILNLDCTVGHDATIEDFVTMAPSVNISGSVRVGEGCDLGTGATVIQGVEIGEWTIVGAGAVVVRDLPPNVTAVGVPATVIKERDAGWHEA